MKRIAVLFVIPVLMALLAAPVLAQMDLPSGTDLIADGRDTALDVGDLIVEADGTIAFVIDEDGTDWRLEETHLYVGDEAPSKSSPGQFPYKHEELGLVTSDVYVVDFAAADLNGDGVVYVAAHAGLSMQVGVDPDTGEPIYADESAWAQGDEAIGKAKNWATCFAVNVPSAG